MEKIIFELISDLFDLEYYGDMSNLKYLHSNLGLQLWVDDSATKYHVKISIEQVKEINEDEYNAIMGEG